MRSAARSMHQRITTAAGEHGTLALLLAGAGLAVWGIWRIDPSAGAIAGGLVVAALALLWELGREA